MDAAQFYDSNVEEDFEYKGYRCLVKTTPLGHRCGYVVLPAGHVLSSDLDAQQKVPCHGGVTFAENIGGDYAIGFDCAHTGDATDPSLMENEELARLLNSFASLLPDTPDGGHLWTREEVHAELETMVDYIESLEN